MTLSLTYKGFNYVSYYNGAYENADSLPSLVATGANAVALNLDYGIDVKNSTVYADANYTDSLTALGDTIAEASADGLSVMVRPLIDFVDPSLIGPYGVGDWRSEYNPVNPATFFGSYRTMIVNEAKVAQANGATMLSIGAEMDQITGPQYLNYWTGIISAVRAVFAGKLTYSADWDDDISPWKGADGLSAGTGNLATQVSFWNQLDYVGIDCYAPLSDAANPTLAQLIAGWTQVPTDATSKAVTGNQSLIGYFQSVAAASGKPLLFTELGYESATDAAAQPSGSSTNVFDPNLQALLYQAFFNAWNEDGNGSLAGVYFWNWDPNAAEVGPGNGANFSPQGLPAQNVVTTSFATPAPSGLTLSPTSDSGIAGDNITNITTPIIIGFGEAGDTVTLDDGSTLVGSGTVADNGTWTITSSPLALGVHRLTATEAGSGGGMSAASAPLSLTIIGQTPSGATADMIVQDTGSGAVGLYDIGNNAVQASFVIGQIGLEWQLLGFGGFDGTDTSDFILRQSGTNALDVFDVANNRVAAAAPLGNIGAEWQVLGFGDFSGNPGETDMLMRNTGNNNIDVFDIQNNRIVAAGLFGNIGSEWRVLGFGDFSGNPGETDMLMRNSGNNNIDYFDIQQNRIVAAGSFGNIDAEWQVLGIGDFSGNPSESDILMRNTGNNAIDVFDIQHNQIVAAGPLGNIGTEWQVMGFGDFSANPGESDMVMRNTGTGAFDYFDIQHNQIVAAGPLANIGVEWRVFGVGALTPQGT